MNSNLKFKLENIPKKPGCYLWKNEYKEVIYVGKAKNLFLRTHQYFLKDRDSKTTKLVENIYDLDFIVVENENESLILENNLIKKYQPKYNVLLKEGSGYPYIVLTNEQLPRLLYTRDLTKYDGKYFGPFATSKSNKYELYNLLLQIFPFRKCNFLKQKKCLYYDINQCLGPCIQNIEKNRWDELKNEVSEFFKGKTKKIIDSLKQQEAKHAKFLEFEEAKKKLNLINGIKEISVKQNINFNSKKNIDVVGFHQQNSLLSIVIFSYLNGKLLAKNQQIADLNTFNIEETITNYLMQYYYENKNKPEICYVNLFKKNTQNLSKVNDMKFIMPYKGKFKDIQLEATKNAKEFFNNNYLIYKQKIRNTKNSFEELKKILNINNLNLIHVFDISNLFKDNQIGGMIALKNGSFDKQLYRKFIIKNLEANSDSERIYEVIFRKYSRCLTHNEPLPNLIIVDGGSIQINAAIDALSKLNLDKIIPVIGLSKDRNHKTNAIIFPNKNNIKLDKDSSLFLFLFNIQEEVHRYAINFFRNKNFESKFKTKLNEIDGLGPKSIEKLLKHYENYANIKKASLTELSQFIGIEIAKKIKKKIHD